MAFALIGIEVALAEAEVFGCDFEEFVVFDEVDALLEAKVGKRRELYYTIAAA